MRELGHNLSINSICSNFTPREWATIIPAQEVAEQKIDATLLHDSLKAEAISGQQHSSVGTCRRQDRASFSSQWL